MALLKDLLVNGVSRLIGDVFILKINAPTTTGGTTFGSGTSGLVLKTNGSTIYWDNDGVNSATEHYTPSTDSGSALTKSASGGTAAWSVDVVKGITISRDAKGHVTDLSVTSGKTAANPLPALNVTHSAAAVAANNIAVWNAAATSSAAAVLKDSGKAFVTTAPSSSGTDALIPTSKAVWSAISGASGYGKEGTVTSVRVLATSPLASSVNTALSSTLDTTISFSNVDANKVLAGPTSGNAAAPSFRLLGLLTDINYTIEDLYLNFEQVTTDGTLHTLTFALSDTLSDNFNTVLLDKCLFKLVCPYGISYSSTTPNSDPLLIVLKSFDLLTTYFSGALSVKLLTSGAFNISNVNRFDIDIADYFICNKENTKINLYNASAMSAGAVNSLVYTKNPFTHAGILNHANNIKIAQDAGNKEYFLFDTPVNGTAVILATNTSISDPWDYLTRPHSSLYTYKYSGGQYIDTSAIILRSCSLDSSSAIEVLNSNININTTNCSIGRSGDSMSNIGAYMPLINGQDATIEFGDVCYFNYSNGMLIKCSTAYLFGCFIYNPMTIKINSGFIKPDINSGSYTMMALPVTGMCLAKTGNYNVYPGLLVCSDANGKVLPISGTYGSSGNYANAVIGVIIGATGVYEYGSIYYTLGKNNYVLIKLR